MEEADTFTGLYDEDGNELHLEPERFPPGFELPTGEDTE